MDGAVIIANAERAPVVLQETHIEGLPMIIRSIKRLFASDKTPKTARGTIKFFDRKKRFGFIVVGKNEYFFHGSAAKPSDFSRLKDGVTVEFTLVQGKKGLQADKLVIVEP